MAQYVIGAVEYAKALSSLDGRCKATRVPKSHSLDCFRTACHSLQMLEQSSTSTSKLNTAWPIGGVGPKVISAPWAIKVSTISARSLVASRNGDPPSGRKMLVPSLCSNGVVST